MSRKLDYIPPIESYDDIRKEMIADLQYRLCNRTTATSFGRPLYFNINVQVIVTQECPHNCPFCLERKNPMMGDNDFDSQIESLKRVLCEHRDARLTITGGEPGLYPDHVQAIIDTYKWNSNNRFCSINTTGINTGLCGMAHINLSKNDHVDADERLFPGCTVQTVMEEPTLKGIDEYINKSSADSFSIRFLSDVDKTAYPIRIWNELRCSDEVDVHAFRIGDFFVYVTFDYKGKHIRVVLGDMYQQRHNKYEDGYSNIIIHPNGRIGLNWT